MKSKKYNNYQVMLTPFNNDGSIDFGALRELTEFYIATGATGLFSNCLSSEMFFLSEKERLEIIKTTVDQVNGRCPVVATATFSEEMNTTVGFIKKVNNAGVNEVVLNTSIFTPENASNDNWKNKVELLIQLTEDIPLGLYECPLPYKKLVNADILNWLASTNRFGFFKETSCDFNQIKTKLAAIKNSSIQLFNANIPTLTDSLLAGAAGVASIASNFYPEWINFLLNNVDKNTGKVNRLNDYLTVFDPLIHEAYPASAKYFLFKRGFKITRVTRNHLHLNYQNKIKLDKLLKLFIILSEELGIQLHKF